MTTIAHKTVPQVLDRLQDLLLTSEATDEKKTNEQDEIHEALTALLDWAQNGYRRAELAEHQAASQVLVPALLQHQSISVLIEIMDILSHLAAASASQRQEIHDAGGITVVSDLVTVVGGPRITAAAYKLLSHLALSKACAVTITTDVLSHTLAQSLQDDKAHIRIVREALGILANLAGHNATQSALLKLPNNNNDDKASIMESLCQVMERHEADVLVQQAACQVWWNLLATAPPKRAKKQDLPPVLETWERLQGMDRILQAMKRHADTAVVQEAACGALSCVAWRPKGADDDARVAATRRVLQTLTQHHTKDDRYAATTTACRALANLCRDCTAASSLVLLDGDDGDNESSNTPLAQLHAIATSACQGDADQVRLALAVLDAWSALAVHAKYAACTALVQAHVVEGVVQCMQAYPNQAIVQDAASLVLWAVAQHYGKYVAAAEGCGEAVATAMETHGEQVRYGARLQGRLQWKQRWGRR